MAVYNLQYTKRIVQASGTYLLQIYKRDGYTSTTEIGNVLQSLILEIQGQQDDIDAPIVKTSLSMTFADAGDIDNGKKNGFWEEFYTPDALLWKVVLQRVGSDGLGTRIWGGYVTPDSFTEDLVYRGSVNIIARDNIGHLQDFVFDAEGNEMGMISFRDLVYAAWAKIESPMNLILSAPNRFLHSNGVSALDTMLNVSAFEGKNWYEVLEDVLFAYGAVLRYTGENTFIVCPLRDLPQLGRANVDEVEHITPIFEVGATRELVPAVKAIEETAKYELENDVPVKPVQPSDFTGENDNYTYEYNPAASVLSTNTGIVHAIANYNPDNGWANDSAQNTLFFNPSLYELSNFAQNQAYADSIKRYMYIAVNNKVTASATTERYVSYGHSMRCQDFAYTLNLGMLITRTSSFTLEGVGGYSLMGISYAITQQTNGITKYYAGDGKWQTSFVELHQDIQGSEGANSITLPVIVEKNNAEDVSFVLYIRCIQYQQNGNQPNGYGIYAALHSLCISVPSAASMLQTNNVNTKYDELNNVTITRSPKIAPALNNIFLPSVIKNGIFVQRGNLYDAAKLWHWEDGSDQQMAVWQHLSLIAYYAKPNNLLSGTIVNTGLSKFHSIYEWGGNEHILVSGRYNLITGHLEGALLREFARYEDMWNDVAGGASLPDTEQSSSANVEAASSAPSATYNNTTIVTIGTGGEGGGGATSLNELSDVNVTGALVNSLLYYNGSTWVAQEKDTFLKDVNDTLTAYSNVVLEQGAALAAMWKLSDDGSSVKTEKNVLIKGYTAIHSGNIGLFSVANANTATSATKLANKRKLWGQEFDGSEDIVGSLQFNAIAGNGWYHGIKFMDSDGTTQLSVIGAYGLSTGFQYVYIGGTHTSPHFSIDANGKAIFNGVLEPKKNVYCANSVYVRGAHLMLGNKEAGIYLTKTGIWWHDENDSWVANLLGFDKTTIKAYQTLRPNTNQLCALGSSSYRWSGVYAATGDFSGNVTIKGASVASMTEGAGALNIGSGAVLMLDANDIQAKANGTTVAPLFINSWGGALYLGHADYSTRVYGYLLVDKALSVTGNITCAANLIVTGDVASA